MNKQAELSEILNVYDCDIVGICETWLKEHTTITAFNSMYQVFRQDRVGSNGGGILLGIKNNILCKLVKQIYVNRCECLLVDVQSSNSEFVRYCLVYRPPDTNFSDSIELFNVIFEYLQNAKSYVLFGDFNLPDISWSDITASSHIGRELLTLSFKLGAVQLVNFPTRGDNTLDLIFCPDKGVLKSIEHVAPFCDSDHDSILCCIYNHTKIVEAVSKPSFQKADYGLINAFLSTVDWNVVYANCSTTNEHWAAFKNVINTAIFNFVPFVSTGRKRNVPWFNSNLKNLRTRKQRKWKKYIRSRNIVSHAEYKTSAQNFRSEFIKAKLNYEQNLFSNQNNNGKFFGYIKSQTSVNTSIPCIKKSDGNIAMNDHEKCSEFSKYFSSVFVNDNHIMPEFTSTCTDTLSSFTCSTRDISKTVKKLRGNSSPGPDGITVLFLKNVIANIAGALCKVYNMSITEGVLPHDWKVAHIIPLFKKGDPQLPLQYRPVSLTSVICKILERIIHSQMLEYIVRNNIIPHCQHGFLPKKSTTTNLLECLNDWTRNYDNNLSTDIIYLDYSKCFDKVCHSKLLLKLTNYGIIGPAHHWIENFLTNRVQHVKINNSVSESAMVISGVPQGTVLGPLLFLFYSADLPNEVLHSDISIYADDTKLYKAIHNVNDCIELQNDLNRIYSWAQKWQMELNPDKTKLLTIGCCTYNFEYSLNNNVITRVNFMKDVGVIIQSDLKFTKHCSEVIKKAYFVLKNIFTILKYHNYEFYLKMYVCYVRPVLEYASQVWSPILKGNVDKIERVQRYFTRRILYSYNLEYGQRLEHCKLDSLEQRRLKSDLLLFYKMINGITIINIEDSYTFVNTSRGHELHLFKYYCRTEKRKLYWINRIVNNWNSLCSNVVNSNSFRTFKKKLQHFNFIGRGSIYCF